MPSHHKGYPSQSAPDSLIARDGSTPEERLMHAALEEGRCSVDGKPSDKNWRDSIVSGVSNLIRR